jgi:hypothetical protein
LAVEDRRCEEEVERREAEGVERHGRGEVDEAGTIGAARDSVEGRREGER